MIEVKASGQACGATVTGLDLSIQFDATTLRAVRAAWLKHHVLAFPDQTLSDADLERIVQSLGVFGSEPYFLPIEGSEHVVALTRTADEKAPLFAENWHSDWSFLPSPPAAMGSVSWKPNSAEKYATGFSFSFGQFLAPHVSSSAM